METKLNSLNIIDDLVINPQFNKSKIKKLLDELSQEAYAGPLSKYLFAAARFVREKSYGHNVFLRGLIEFTNYCKNDCYYCGIRCSNHKATRYRLSLEEILLSCEIGYKNNLRTFVLQGGEDMYFSDDKMIQIIKEIKINIPNVLSLYPSVKKQEQAIKNILTLEQIDIYFVMKQLIFHIIKNFTQQKWI